MPAVACESCGCSLSDWSIEGYSPGAGLRVDYRYDYINQDQWQAGTQSVDRGSIALPSANEVQQSTVTRYQNLSLDWSPNGDWGVNALLPYLDRHHTTIAPGDTAISTSDTNGIGDLRLVGRFQGFLPNHNLGVQFGLKLPTGAFRDTFSEGPQAGQPLDRGLQDGTGTTDLIVGAFEGGALSRNWDRFEALSVKQPLHERDDFKPGTQVLTNLGARYLWRPWLMPQLQLNAKWEGRESGAQSDRDNSGSTEVMVSPGVATAIGSKLIGFLIVQLPVYRDVNGTQLLPRYNASIGVRIIP